VLLTGYATDATTLHEYLAHLDSDPLVERVDLRSIEHANGDAATGSAAGHVHFTARAMLAQGIGQTIEPGPAAPAGPAAGPTTAAATHGEQR
jgi:hypothetical protein